MYEYSLNNNNMSYLHSLNPFLLRHRQPLGPPRFDACVRLTTIQTTSIKPIVQTVKQLFDPLYACSLSLHKLSPIPTVWSVCTLHFAKRTRRCLKALRESVITIPAHDRTSMHNQASFHAASILFRLVHLD